MQKLISNIQHLVAENELELVFEKLLQEKTPQSLHSELLILKSRFETNEQSNRIGIITYPEYNLELNRIKNSLLNLLEQLKSSKDLKNDSPPSNVGFFDINQLQIFANSKKKSIKFYLRSIFILLIFGIIIIVFGTFIEEVIIKGFGMFTSFFSGYPFSKFSKKKDDLDIINQVLNCLESCKDEKQKEVHLKKIESIFWKRFESVMLS